MMDHLEVGQQLEEVINHQLLPYGMVARNVLLIKTGDTFSLTGLIARMSASERQAKQPTPEPEAVELIASARNGRLSVRFAHALRRVADRLSAPD